MMIRRAATLAVVTCLVVSAGPARADGSISSRSAAPAVTSTQTASEAPRREETFNERTDRTLWSTEKKIAIYATFGAMFISAGVSWFSFIKAVNANSELQNDFRTGDCRTEADCARLRQLVADQKAWADRGIALTSVSIGLAAGTFALAWLLPNGKTTMTPSASLSKDGASFAVAGHF